MALKIAVIGGDGTGPEVTAEAVKVLGAVAEVEGFAFETTDIDLGGERYLKTGHILSDEDIEQLRGYDAIMLGAIGHPDVKPGVLEKGLLLNLRFKMDQYINLRPVKLYPGVDTPLKDKGPEDIDFDVIRENTEDLYCGNGGILRVGTQQEVATQEMIATRFGAERCIRYAFDFCRRKKEQGTGKHHHGPGFHHAHFTCRYGPISSTGIVPVESSIHNPIKPHGACSRPNHSNDNPEKNQEIGNTACRQKGTGEGKRHGKDGQFELDHLKQDTYFFKHFISPCHLFLFSDSIPI